MHGRRARRTSSPLSEEGASPSLMLRYKTGETMCLKCISFTYFDRSSRQTNESTQGSPIFRGGRMDRGSCPRHRQYIYQTYLLKKGTHQEHIWNLTESGLLRHKHVSTNEGC